MFAVANETSARYRETSPAFQKEPKMGRWNKAAGETFINAPSDPSLKKQTPASADSGKPTGRVSSNASLKTFSETSPRGAETTSWLHYGAQQGPKYIQGLQPYLLRVGGVSLQQQYPSGFCRNQQNHPACWNEAMTTSETLLPGLFWVIKCL
uniref:Uncharacterized protein n=2 Tax=Nothobranchius furzeri TaxID=105023 RepID=A0A1A8V1N2_NOTFU